MGLSANFLRRKFKVVGFRHSGPGKSLSINFVLSDKVAWREIKCRPKREPPKQTRERGGEIVRGSAHCDGRWKRELRAT